MTELLKPYHIKKLARRGDLRVWIIDGTYIRSHIDKEFTNFGQHYRYPYIPINELWLDREAARNERTFFIDHLLVEHRLMAAGMLYEEALPKADQAEKKERRRAGDNSNLTLHGKKLPNARDVHERLWKKLEDGISVWIVNGRFVRSVFDIDFTEGGHDHVYKYVPKNEVWIDDDIFEVERGYVLLHELHERNRMAKGWSYNKAHAESSRMEYRCRHHPKELTKKLIAEGWV